MAAAATYYVSPTGSASNAGTQAAPWNLTKANSSLVAGDVAILVAGTYTTSIAPAQSGASYTSRITYVGSLSSPGSVVVPSISITSRSYVTVKGVKFSGNVGFESGHDSLAYCTADAGTISFGNSGSDCSVSNCTLTGEQMGFSGSGVGESPTFIYRDTLSDCTFNLNLTGYGPALRINASSNLVFRRCRLYISIGATGNHGTFKMYNGRYGRFTDCLFDIQSQHSITDGGCDECNTSYYRDYSQFNVFLRDTFLLRGSQRMEEMPSASGSYYQSTHGNKWDSCVFRQSAPGNFGLLYWEDGSRADTLVNCTVISKDLTPVQLRQFSAGCLIKNNTFIQLSPGAAANIGTWTGQTGVYNNIFYTLPGSASGASGAAVTADASIAGGNWTGNNNLYFCTNPAASSVYVSGTGRGPGASGTMCSTYASECASKYGDPLFVGGSDVMTFNPRLTSTSPAIGAGLGGVDMGAYSFGSGGGDTTPPSTVSDLASIAVTSSSVTLRWTAPGDDGASGTPTSYDLRRSTQPITSANFASATPVSPQPPTVSGGTTQTYVALSLSASTTYHFALRAVDEAGNWSGASNDVAATTSAAADTTPPAAIGDLHAD
jgi:hypothetical protein